MRLTAFIVFLLGLFLPSHAQRFRFSPLSEATIRQRAQDPPAGREDREAKVKLLFTQAGCGRDRLTEQPLGNMPAANIICRLPGKGKDTIIVGANYGKAGFDNWSGAALLPSLYQSLGNRKRRHTFIFIAFADGASDLAGSHFFTEQMSQAEVDHTAAMINLDALGFSPTKISSGDSDKKLVEQFFIVVYALKQMGSQVDLSKAVRRDSEPFAARNIPQITLHSLTQETLNGLQSQPQASSSSADAGFAHMETGFRSDLYYSSYHLISGYLAYLDETLKRRPNK